MENATIRALRIEHRNFEHVLSLVRFHVQVTRIHDQEACQFLANAIGYLQQFEGCIHLEKEKLIYEKLLKLDDSLAGICNRLHEQRELMREQELSMLRDIWQAKVGDIEACKRIKEIAAAYCDAQLGYISLEEANLFLTAANRLQRGDWRDIEERFKNIVDPVFGPEARKQHETPYDGLMALGSIQ